MDNSKLVVVFDAEDEISALLYRTMLEEAGIDVIERPLEVIWFEGVRQRALHSQLLVRETDAAQARTLVEAFRADAEAGELNAAEEDSSQSDK